MANFLARLFARGRNRQAGADTGWDGQQRLMTIFPHPDDETFGVAGTMARVTARGGRCAVVCATKGEAGEIADPQLATKENLGQVREQELRTAMAAVGVTDISFLGYLDGHVAEAPKEEIIGKIVYHLRRFRPQVIVTFAANGMYGHKDHIATHYLALAAAGAAADPRQYPDQLKQGLAPHRVMKVYFVASPRERLLERAQEIEARTGQPFIPGGNEATIPLEEMGTPMSHITTFIQLNDAEFAAKMAAMRAHATQMPADSPFMSAAPEELRAFMGTETFELAPPPFSAQWFPTPEDDLFAGL